MKNQKETFNAAVLTKINNPLKILKLKFPKDLKKGQVLVKLKSSSICGAQANEITGIKGPDKYLPHMMGHEGFGTVLKIGPGVKKIKKGQDVIMHWRKGNGIEAEGASYHSERLGKINSGKVTTFSEVSIVSENRVTSIKLPKEIEKIAPCFGCSLTTAFGVVHNDCKMKINENVIIFGTGGLGMSIAAMARSYGVKDITFVDKKYNKFKLKFIKKLKLNKNHILSPNILFKKNLKLRYNHVIDTTGDINLISFGFDLLKKNANLVLVGQPRVGKNLKLNNALSFFEGKKIFASDGGNITPSSDLKKIAKHVINNFQYFKGFISHNIFLKDINKGFRLLKKGEALRVSLKF
tara:strand:+ start:68 stop:1120 length:1053 start_codon:yes stop_codon:yes gene_type:complete